MQYRPPEAEDLSALIAERDAIEAELPGLIERQSDLMRRMQEPSVGRHGRAAFEGASQALRDKSDRLREVAEMIEALQTTQGKGLPK